MRCGPFLLITFSYNCWVRVLPPPACRSAVCERRRITASQSSSIAMPMAMLAAAYKSESTAQSVNIVQQVS